eukprot:g328.t1
MRRSKPSLLVIALLAAAMAKKPKAKKSIRLTLDSMASSTDNAVAQLVGLRKLADITDDDARALAVREGGVGRTLNAMGTHTDDVKIQERGCEALAALVTDDRQAVTEAFESGAVDAVVAALQLHEAVVSLVLKACWILLELSQDSEAAAKLAGDGFKQLVSAMDAQAQDKDVQECSCELLANLADTGHSARVAIRAAGGVKRVANAMNAHVGDTFVQKKGCEALSKLLADEDVKPTEIVRASDMPALAKQLGAPLSCSALATIIAVSTNDNDGVDATTSSGLQMNTWLIIPFTITLNLEDELVSFDFEKINRTADRVVSRGTASSAPVIKIDTLEHIYKQP